MRYDAIVVGGGHNGLVSAAYLAKAGLKTLVLERRGVLGGASVTEEPWPGYKVSSLAYLCSLLQPAVIQELELRRHGYRIYPKDPSFFTPLEDGRHLFFWGDQERTLAEIAKFSPADARAFPAYEAQLERIAEVFERTLPVTPPDLPFARLSDLATLAKLAWPLRRMASADMAAMSRLMTQSVADYLDDRFESDLLKATLATDGIIGAAGGARVPGSAYTLLHHVMGDAGGKRGLWGFVRGGMGGVSLAIASAARAAGAEIRTNAPVARVEPGKVVLADGAELEARVVLSSADPKRTFLGLVPAEHLPPEFRRDIANFRMDGHVFKINLALDGVPPFKAYPGEGITPAHRTTFHICPSMDYIDRAWRDAEQGRPSERPILECTLPTAYDDSLAPPGKHVMNLFVQYAPYRLKEGSWDDLKEPFADRCVDLLEEFMPGLKRRVVHRQALSPLDMEREYGLTGGHILHGELRMDQMFFMRPAPGWASYRTPVKGLYLCGSGAHPGGGVMGAPGRNAAREVLRDLKAGKA